MDNYRLDENRTVYFDYLRVLATVCVVFIHEDLPVGELGGACGKLTEYVSAITDSMAMWVVPVFVMISGAIFLNRDISVKKIYSKYALRLLVAWIVWSVVYGVSTVEPLSEQVRNIIHSRRQVHLWFLPLMIGLYICIPILKQITASKSVTKYFLSLALIFNFLFFHISLFIGYFGSDFLFRLKNISGIDHFVKLMELHLVSGYSSYFVLGHFLNKSQLSPRRRTVIYALGFVGFVSSCIFYLIQPYRNETRGVSFFFPDGYFLVNFLLEAVAVFVFFKYCNLKQNRVITTLSKYSFGAYLVHYLVLKQLSSRFGLNVLSFNPIVSFVVVGTVAAAISFAISALLHQIPIVKKYLV